MPIILVFYSLEIKKPFTSTPCRGDGEKALPFTLITLHLDKGDKRMNELIASPHISPVFLVDIVNCVFYFFSFFRVFSRAEKQGLDRLFFFSITPLFVGLPSDEAETDPFDVV